jgi:hypothetical protein
MPTRLSRLAEVLHRVYGGPLPPGVLERVPALADLAQGLATEEVASRHGLRHPAVVRWQSVLAGQGEDHVLGIAREPGDEESGAARRILGQMLLGELAERAFEQRYRRRFPDTEFAVRDDRESRSDTDYRVLNGRGRPIFRINIKFHGTLFRNAQDLVGLAPEDCFALGTCKIWGALQKQEAEHLPYIFIVVSVPDMTAAVAGAEMPEDLVWLAAVVKAARKITRKRAVEERIVQSVLDAGSPVVSEFGARLESAPWKAISARRADSLVRQKLYERVYALRVRGFARNYRAAEVDMHFSLREDMVDLDDLFGVLHERGVQALVGRLSDGTL